MNTTYQDKNNELIHLINIRLIEFMEKVAN